MRLKVHCLRRVEYLRLYIQIAENPLEERERGLELDRHLQQAADGEVQPRLKRGEGDDGARRQSRRGVAGEHVAGQNVNDHRRQGEKHLHRREEGLTRHHPTHRQVSQPLVLPVKTLDLLILTSEKLGQHDA